MKPIQSLEDLEKAKEEAQRSQQRIRNKFPFHILIGMSSCGIAAGAKETYKAINRQIEEENIKGIQVTQTGCIGLCALEPIVQVQIANQSTTTYGKVTPQVAQRILTEHFQNGRIVQEYVVENF